ncbi:MAG: hypothetical protein Q9213_003804 [Squamulea squamosa]
MTPSETVPSPYGGTMLDISQYGSCEDHVTSSPLLTDLAITGNAQPMDLDAVPWPDIFQKWATDEKACRPEDNQDQPAASNAEYPNLQDQETIWSQTSLLASDDPYVAAKVTSLSNQMEEDLMALDQDFPLKQQRLPTSYANDLTPRYVPWRMEQTAAAARPWSPEILSREQLEWSPQAEELLYAPAMGTHQALPEDQPLFPGKDVAEELDQHGPSCSDGYLSNVLLPEDNIDPPPPPDPIGPPYQTADRKGCCYKKGPKPKTAGGRRYQPLNPHSRQHAKATRRNQGQCWSCALQRNECEFENPWDETCIGCQRKRKASLLTHCIRERLPDLTSVFIPTSLAEMHDPGNLRRFAARHISRWLDNHFVVLVSWGHGFRPIKVVATEAECVGDTLLFQNQYRLDLTTKQYDLVQVPSPPLGMQLMAVVEWRAKLGGYLEEILRKSFRRFPEVCFRGDDCRVEKDFLLPIFDFHEVVEGRAKFLVHQALKLVLLTFIMTHSLTIVEDTRDSVYWQLKNRPENLFGQHTCARFLNKQMKFLLCTIHGDVLKDVLNRVQDTLRVSNKKSLWAPLFASMVILAMSIESLQVTVRCKEETDKQEGTIGALDTKADEEIALMDEKFDLLRRIFHQGYRTLQPKGYNPIRNPADRDELDGPSQLLAEKASGIIEKYHDFLVARQTLGPPTTSDPQTARLVAQFLLCFSPPVVQNQPQPPVSASMK